MSQVKQDDWKRKVGGVCWTDIWAWLAELRDERGLWGEVRLVPPMPSQAGKVHGTAVVVLKRYIDGGRVEEITMHRNLPSPARARPEEVVLQMVAELDRRLDREQYEAERASGQLGLPF